MQAYPAFVVGEEDETAIFHPFQQHCACRRMTVCLDCSYRHGGGLVLISMDSIVQPMGELLIGFVVEVFWFEPAFLLFSSDVKEL